MQHHLHGFEKRQIKGVRTSLIINYVTNEWRAREQLVLPGRADRLKRAPQNPMTASWPGSSRPFAFVAKP